MFPTFLSPMVITDGDVFTRLIAGSLVNVSDLYEESIHWLMSCILLPISTKTVSRHCVSNVLWKNDANTVDCDKKEKRERGRNVSVNMPIRAFLPLCTAVWNRSGTTSSLHLQV